MTDSSIPEKNFDIGTWSVYFNFSKFTNSILVSYFPI